MKPDVPMLLLMLMIIVTGCRDHNAELQKDIINDQGLIAVELFLEQDSVTLFWKIREVPGRSTLAVLEGRLGDEGKVHEVFEKSQESLMKKATELTAQKINEGYKIYGPESYLQIIVQVDTLYWGDTGDADKLAFMEDVISQALQMTGNGKCTGSDIAHRVNVFAAVFDAEVAVQTILKSLRDNNLDIPVVIAVEKGGDVTVIYPDKFQGEFSLI
jgi:hypothetical protein